jgi:hypothetical protein
MNGMLEGEIRAILNRNCFEEIKRRAKEEGR